MSALTKQIPLLTFGEEIGNSVSHGVMAGLILLSMPYLTTNAYLNYGIGGLIGISIFLTSLFLMFLSSTLYHSMDPNSKHKKIFRILDHSFIFVAIAGSYTPVALSVIGGWKGILIVAIQWSMVLFGVLNKALSKKYKPKASVFIYLVMGWTIVLFLPTFLANANGVMLALIVAGGLLYSIGAVIYSKRGFKYHHLVWHLCINAASVCHLIGIVYYLK